MSQAIYYIDQSSNQNRYQNSNQHINENSNQKATALNASIPTQAVNIRVGEVLDKTTLLTSLADACDFPSYFSHNWDATWDCLTDSDVTHLKLDLTAVKNINTEDFNTFKRIIEDAYKDFGKPQLWVIVPSKEDA